MVGFLPRDRVIRTTFIIHLGAIVLVMRGAYVRGVQNVHGTLLTGCTKRSQYLVVTRGAGLSFVVMAMVFRQFVVALVIFNGFKRLFGFAGQKMTGRVLLQIVMDF